MRTLVLAAGVLLVVALAVFLAIGKWRNPFNRRDLPQRLGIDIQQEANGVTYTQAQRGHTLYKIHASKVVQMKQGNALLHDVKIELYGADGSRADRIEGDEFEYDQHAGTARAAGPVEITLMRPGEALAIVPKANAEKALGDKAKSGVLAAAARGEIHVRTSGLVFDQHSGVASTKESVEFEMTQGAGSAMGATYDSQQGHLVLDRAVELNTRRGADPVKIQAHHAEFERADQVCNLQGATASFRGGAATAEDAKILFRDDGSAERLDAINGFTLATATGGHLAAPSGHMEFDEHNQPRHGHMEGGVTLDSVSEAAGRHRQMHGTSPTMELEFNARGLLHHAHLEQGVTMDSQEQGEQAGLPLRLSRHWRSPIADVEFRDSKQGKVELSTVHGTGGVVVTGESQRGQGAVVPSRLSGDEVTGQLGPGSVLTGMNGVGHTSIEETTETGTRQTTSGDRLSAHFEAAPPTAKRGQSGDAQLQSAMVEGHVVLTQTPAAKPGAPPQAPMHATAGRADYQGQGEWLHLTVNPRVEDGALQLTADKVDVSRESGDAFAHGNVKASWMSSNSQPGKPAGSQSVVSLGGQGPAHVVATEAQLRHAVGGTTGEATFRGHARVWQQANSIAAPVIVLDRERQTLVARTTDASEPVRAVLLSAGGAAPGSDSAKAQGKENQPSVIRVRGGDLKYSDTERKAVMHSGVLGTVVTETGTATSTSNEVEVTLLPTGKTGDKDSGQAQVDHMTARGHVVLTSEGRRGTVTGEALIFHGSDDSVSVEGGGSKTTTETTAPK